MVKAAKVKNNHFCCIYTERAVNFSEDVRATAAAVSKDKIVEEMNPVIEVKVPAPMMASEMNGSVQTIVDTERRVPQEQTQKSCCTLF